MKVNEIVSGLKTQADKNAEAKQLVDALITEASALEGYEATPDAEMDALTKALVDATTDPKADPELLSILELTANSVLTPASVKEMVGLLNDARIEEQPVKQPENNDLSTKRRRDMTPGERFIQDLANLIPMSEHKPANAQKRYFRVEEVQVDADASEGSYESGFATYRGRFSGEEYSSQIRIPKTLPEKALEYAKSNKDWNLARTWSRLYQFNSDDVTAHNLESPAFGKDGVTTDIEAYFYQNVPGKTTYIRLLDVDAAIKGLSNEQIATVTQRLKDNGYDATGTVTVAMNVSKSAWHLGHPDVKTVGDGQRGGIELAVVNPAMFDRIDRQQTQRNEKRWERIELQSEIEENDLARIEQMLTSGHALKQMAAIGKLRSLMGSVSDAEVLAVIKNPAAKTSVKALLAAKNAEEMEE